MFSLPQQSQSQQNISNLTSENQKVNVQKDSQMMMLQLEELNKNEQDFVQFKNMKFIHQQNNPYQYIKHFQIINSNSIPLPIKIQLFQQLKQQLEDQIKSEENLRYLLRKISCKSTKNKESPNKNYWSIRSRKTADTENQSRISSSLSQTNTKANQEMRAKENENNNKNEEDLYKLQLQTEEDLIILKEKKNKVLEQYYDMQDNVKDVKELNKQLITQNWALNEKIEGFKQIITRLSQKCKTANSSQNISLTLNLTRLNTTIMDEVQNKLQSLKTFIVAKLFQQNVNPESANNNQMILSELDKK